MKPITCTGVAHFLELGYRTLCQLKNAPHQTYKHIYKDYIYLPMAMTFKCTEEFVLMMFHSCCYSLHTLRMILYIYIFLL